MTIQECYRQLDGDFTQVEKALESADLVERFLRKFLDDGSFSDLCIAMAGDNRDKAFRAAHTLKGVSVSLGLTSLHSSASQLAELLRAESENIPAGADLLFEEVKRNYELTARVIRAFLDSDHR